MDIALITLGVIGGPLFMWWARSLMRRNDDLANRNVDLLQERFQVDAFLDTFAAWYHSPGLSESTDEWHRMETSWEELCRDQDNRINRPS